MRRACSRRTTSPREDDNVLVEGVSGDAGGIGYFGFSYYEENQDKLNLVAVDSGKGCVAPSKETIQDGSYTPLGAAAVHLPEHRRLKKRRGQGVRPVLPRQRGHLRGDGAAGPADRRS